MNNLSWYAITTITRREQIAADSLLSAGVQTFSPRTRIHRQTRYKNLTLIESLFPGYIFARCNPVDDFYKIKRAHGAKRLINFAGDYPIVDDLIIDELYSNIDDCGLVVLGRKQAANYDNLEQGCLVDVISGPYSGFAGKLNSTMRGGDRVAVLLTMLGSERPVNLARADVVRAVA